MLLDSEQLAVLFAGRDMHAGDWHAAGGATAQSVQHADPIASSAELEPVENVPK
jgi:hypothetical protein